MEVGVNSQLDRSCCGVGPGAAVGSVAHFGNSPSRATHSKRFDSVAVSYTLNLPTLWFRQLCDVVANMYKV